MAADWAIKKGVKKRAQPHHEPLLNQIGMTVEDYRKAQRQPSVVVFKLPETGLPVEFHVNILEEEDMIWREFVFDHRKASPPKLPVDESGKHYDVCRGLVADSNFDSAPDVFSIGMSQVSFHTPRALEFLNSLQKEVRRP